MEDSQIKHEFQIVSVDASNPCEPKALAYLYNVNKCGYP